MNLNYRTGLFILIAIISIPLFVHLSELPMQCWDEARPAYAALEMKVNGHWLMDYYRGQPDMWNLKPPLLPWLQAICYSIFGLNELAVRLPSAVAAFATCLLIYWFFAKKCNESWLGFISCLVLVTARGFVMLHGSRTGDYDSLLTLFLFSAIISYFLYFEEGKTKHIYLTFLFLTLGVLTKGIAALLFLPAFLLYALYKNKIIQLLRQKQFYIGLAALIFFGGGYYLLREHYNPGYLQAVWDNELGGRYSTVIESHKGDAWTYYNEIISEFFKDWYLLLIPGALLGLLTKDAWIRSFTICALVFSLSHFFILSNSETKIVWYTMPEYPFFCILVGMFIHTIFRVLSRMDFLSDTIKYNVIPLIFLFFIFIAPYTSVINFATDGKQTGNSPENLDMAQMLKYELDGRRNIDGCTVIAEEFQQSHYWYIFVFGQLKKQMAFVTRNATDEEALKNDISKTHKIIAFNGSIKKYIEDHYQTQIIQSVGSATEYQVNGIKQ